MKKLIAWITSLLFRPRLIVMGTPGHGTSISLDPPVGIKAPEVKRPVTHSVPRGCYTYFFDRKGNCYLGPTNEPVVFTCIATNLANATRKFNRFITLNPPADDAGDSVPQGAFTD